MTAHITQTITLAQVRAARPQTIYYGAVSCWWTHDPDHLAVMPDTGLPCDPRGGVLYQTDHVEAFLAAAEARPEHYGRHGLAAFMAAHHQNCHVSASDPRPWCLRNWDEYNDAIDSSRIGAPPAGGVS